MHTYLEAHHLHTHTQKRRFIQKKLTVSDKKAKLWVGLMRVRAWKKNPKVQRLAKSDFQRLKISTRRVRYSLQAGSHMESTQKLYSTYSAQSILSHFC